MNKPIVAISEKDRVDGFPVPKGWIRVKWGDWWVPPGGPWWQTAEREAMIRKALNG